VHLTARPVTAPAATSWFYDQLHHLTGDDPPSQQAVLNELGYLDDGTGRLPTPASLPQTALWVASGWQRDIGEAAASGQVFRPLNEQHARHASWLLFCASRVSGSRLSLMLEP
jgi:hypothetical protein